MSSRGRMWAGAAVGLALTMGLLVVVWPRRAPPPARPPAPKSKPAPPQEVTRTYDGVIAAQHTVLVEAVASGTVEAFLADVGQTVTEGQVLARLASGAGAAEPADSFASVDAAQAKVSSLEAALGEAKLGSERLKGDARRAQDQADRAAREYGRQKALNEAGATPRNVFEQAERDYRLARDQAATVAENARRAENRIYATDDELKAARAAAVQTGKAAIQSRASTAAAEIHAPVAGVVVARNVEPGQAVAAGSGKGLFEIATDPSLLRARFDLDPIAAARLRPGADLTITVPEAKAASIVAKLTALEGAHAVSDFSDSSATIRPGMTCQVSLQLK